MAALCCTARCLLFVQIKFAFDYESSLTVFEVNYIVLNVVVDPEDAGEVRDLRNVGAGRYRNILIEIKSC